jgi:hypothetical protein
MTVYTSPSSPAGSQPRPRFLAVPFLGEGVILAAAVAAYFLFPDTLGLLTRILIMMIFVLSIDLVLGYAGRHICLNSNEPRLYRTITAVGACVEGGVGEVSLAVLAQKMKIDKSSAHHRVRKAIERGYLVNREEKRGMPARIAISDPLPEEIEILPTEDALGECWKCWS